jgi:hypothetical protein
MNGSWVVVRRQTRGDAERSPVSRCSAAGDGEGDHDRFTGTLNERTSKLEPQKPSAEKRKTISDAIERAGSRASRSLTKGGPIDNAPAPC